MSAVKTLREERGILQEEMARLIKVSLPSYCKKENGQVKYSLAEAKTIADFFGKSIEQVFFERDISKTVKKEDTQNADGCNSE